MKHALILFVTLCLCLSAGHAHSAGFSGDALSWNSGTQFTKAKSGAFVDIVVLWGGHRGIQKFMVMRGVVPRFSSAPVSFVTGTAIPLNAVGDFYPWNWSTSQQIGAVTALGLGIWAISNHNRTSHSRRGYTVPSDEGDEDSDFPVEEDDSDFFEHCYNGNGYDGEYNEQHCF